MFRAILLYNKHGLLVDDFEREYRIQEQKPVPFKLFGYDSTYDLLNSIPDVVKVLNLEGHPTLLLAVTTERTQHVAKLVGNQLDGRRGFNRRTGDIVSSFDVETREKIYQEVGFRDRQVSDLVKSQIRELLEMDDNMNGILLSKLNSEYFKNFEYNIREQEFGFESLEDFCMNGLADVVDVDSDCGNLKIVEKGLLGQTKSISVFKKIPHRVKINVRNLVRNSPGQNMLVEDLEAEYADNFEPLKLHEFGIRSFAGLCLLMPDYVKVTGDRVTPTGPVEEAESLQREGRIKRVAANVAELLHGRKECLGLNDFIRGYEGWHGNLDRAVREAGATGVKQLLAMMEDVCRLETSDTGEVVVVPTQPVQVVTNTKRDLQDKPHEVSINELPWLYMESTGDTAEDYKFGFQSVILLREAEINSERPRQELTAGYVRVQWRGPGQLLLQQENMMAGLRQLEEEMEQFYTEQRGGRRLTEAVCEGRLVAALYSDLAWHRARVLRTEAGSLLLHYLDWGWEAAVTREEVRELEVQFSLLADQARLVTRTNTSIVGDVSWDQVPRGRGRGKLLTAGQHSGLTGLNLQLFTPSRPASRPGGRGQFRNYKRKQIREMDCQSEDLIINHGL